MEEDVRKRLTVEQASAVWNVLRKPVTRVNAPPRWTRFLKEGWVLWHDLEDILLMQDHRLGCMSGIRLEDLCRVLGYQTRSVAYRPRATSTSASLFDAFDLFEVAALLADLERLGFTTNASTLVASILPAIPKGGLISAAQLEVFWFAKTRHKGVIEVEAERSDKTWDRIDDEILPTGQRAEVWFDKEGRPVTIKVFGAKYRRRKKPSEVVCPDCGVTWYKGDTDSSARHRAEHKKRMKVLDPAPSPDVLARRQENDAPEHVAYASPRWMHDVMDELALYFRRETKYGFCGWGVVYENDFKAQGYLFTSPDGAIIGAAAFRWRAYTDAPDGWALQWVYVVPKYRRTGVLRSRWAEFRERFGGFHVEGPISPNMQIALHHLEPEQFPAPEQ